ncbi:metallophosphoesterase family protein [Paenibacillus cremeus]|uniref:Metallophosphoesterase n=1 Tax=Paenibacillus cremeus TaxID=2163881 RepID=A0A559KFA3_9BACL|nr:metallophosphoesterase [Paenibacillus cremeus]TVY10812.1 metallophosphoesterase [Paenibacillus cremeus]
MRVWKMLLAGMMLVTGTSAGATARAEGEGLTFAVISDIHVQSWNGGSIRKFGRALDDLQQSARPAQALIINGDLGNGFPEDYQAVNKVLARHPHPTRVYYTIGNHEFYKAWHDPSRRWSMETFPNGESDQASVARFLQQSGEPNVYYEKHIGGYTFLFLGSERYRQSNPTYSEDAYLSQQQLDWLSSRLKEESGQGKPIFIFLHQPLPNTVSGSIPGSSGRGVVQAAQLQAILANYPKVILFTGHTHWELSLPDTVVHEQFVMVNSSSVYEPYQGLGGPYPQEADRSEGLVVEVSAGQVVIKGRDFREGKWLGSYVLKYQ